jgi:DNA-binding transcriptional LysR family regulator
VAANLSAITQFLPKDLQSFRAKNPLIQVHVEEKVSTAVLTAVAENAVDVGLIVQGPKTRGLLFNDDIVGLEATSLCCPIRRTGWCW